MNLIYKGSVNGFKAEAFHKYVDNQGPTLSIIKSERQQIFGGYTDISWTSNKGFKNGDGNSFIFSLRDDSNFVLLKCLNK